MDVGHGAAPRFWKKGLTDSFLSQYWIFENKVQWFQRVSRFKWSRNILKYTKLNGLKIYLKLKLDWKFSSLIALY
jgi:hypothetical protein